MSAVQTVFPGTQWEEKEPGEVGIAEGGLKELSEGTRHRIAIVRNGYLVAEWCEDVEADERLWLASAAKSVYSCVLGIAVAEGKIESADAKVIDYYPEMMDVPEGEGPKPGRFAAEKDREITFRQLICNTSGYMKPGEMPGTVFHYQTFGMNILTHSIAKQYGYYDSDDPEGQPGFGKLMEEKIRDRIGATWTCRYMNFEHPPEARLGIFGFYHGISSTARDMARLGWLWLNGGSWDGEEIVPEAWMREITRTAPDIREHCGKDEWKYGHGFWVNDHGKLWPDLPRDGFAARGAGGQHICVFPGLELVVVMSPCEESDEVLRRVVEACAR
jgi:CubicO group peptidase (beta-lactamase class C family)